MMNDHPELLVIAGPYGAGKSTLAPSLVRDRLNVSEFVNADVIAQGLAAYDVESVAVEAGRFMLTRLRDLANKRKSFAFETTLAARSYASWIEGLRTIGYEFHLVFLWLPAPDFAIQRVADRVKMGGHEIHSDVIRRRYRSGLKNFFDLYQPIADTWRLIDNSDIQKRQLIASGCTRDVKNIGDPAIWNDIVKEYAT